MHKIGHIRGRDTAQERPTEITKKEPDAIDELVTQIKDVIGMKVKEDAVIHFAETYDLAEDITIQRDDVPLTTRALDDEEVEAIDNQIVQEALMYNTKTIADPQELAD